MRFNYWQKFYEGHFYHIYNRSNTGERLFLTAENYRFFMEKWMLYLGPYLDIYAYVLMPNHFHFIVCVKTADESFYQSVSKEQTVASQKFLEGEILISAFLEDQFKRLFTSYTDALKKQTGRRGSLFQKGFKRVVIDNEVVLLDKICYVHHNPIHHGFTKNYESWLYSSYNAYLSNSPTKIAREEGLLLFHNLEPSKMAFVNYHAIYKAGQVGLKSDDDMNIGIKV